MFTRYALLTIVISVAVHIFPAFAEDLFADKLFERGEYKWAFLEYERLYFSEKQEDVRRLYSYRAGVCQMNSGNYTDALFRFSSLYSDAVLGDSALLNAGLCELHRGKSDSAGGYLSRCRLDYAKIADGYRHFLSGEYPAGLDKVQSVSEASVDAFRANALKKCISDAAAFKKKHYAPALFLSFVPGLGHIYTRETGDAAMTAITIATGSLVTAYYHYHDAHYKAIAAGTVTGLLYLGGMYGAVMSVKIYNRKHYERLHATAERIVFKK